MTAKLAEALAKAQSQLKGAVKDASNPFFKSKYADLTSVWEACRKPLSDNGLSVAQPTDYIDGMIVVRTVLLHSSGEKLEGILPIQVGANANAQQVGSAITYARRYALSSMVGVAPEDDDGNAASEAPPKEEKKVSAGLRVKNFEKAMDACKSQQELDAVVMKGGPLLAELNKSTPEAHDELMRKISKHQEAFTLSNAAE